MWHFKCSKCSVEAEWPSDFTPPGFTPSGKLRPSRQNCERCIAWAAQESGSDVCTSCLKPVSKAVSAAERARAGQGLRDPGIILCSACQGQLIADISSDKVLHQWVGFATEAAASSAAGRQAAAAAAASEAVATSTASRPASSQGAENAADRELHEAGVACATKAAAEAPVVAAIDQQVAAAAAHLIRAISRFASPTNGTFCALLSSKFMLGSVDQTVCSHGRGDS